MKDFNLFLKKLLDKPSTETTLLIKGKKKKIKGMARFTTVNYQGDEYIKIVFSDHSFLLILINDHKLYYSDEHIIRNTGINDEIIGKKEIIQYKGKKYKLDNKDDYQFCLQLYVGSPSDIEGECRFSDYFPIKGPKEFLSLGWISHTRKRADINPKIIDQEEVEIVKK